MKKFYYLLASIAIVLVTITACQNDSIEVEEMQAIQDEEVLLAKGNDKVKVDICHWDSENEMYVSISVAPEAVDKHMANHMTDYGTHVEKDKLTFSPEGIWTIHKLNTGNNVHGDYILDIDTFDGTTYSGTGERDVTGNPKGDTLYVNIFITVDDSGAMMIHMEQWFNMDKLPEDSPQNSFDFFGTTGMCDGITEVHHGEGAVQEFWLITDE